MESALFDSISLLPSQLLEDFYSIILEKGRILGKPERDLINKFTSGLPPALAFHARVSRCETFSVVLTVAKTGEAFGFRTPTNSISTSTPVREINTSPAYSGACLAQEVRQLSAVVEKLVLDGQRQQYSPAPRVSNASNQRTCQACGGPGHVQRACAWLGNGIPDLTPAVHSVLSLDTVQ
ncbi:hypothetical protein KP79_PYT05689 [Mizuhopecten yessoensis]|uniref:CCHC-type domain-containing protein n=1 Tax=Mizuhopecten yessoensis TaxID=6573 RepID=A0A210QG49_MIZYE|nr:hypothetical protein KP79_PYT05689 [Mizuhopecten yessoensis]